jgi:hypothetical protein
VKKQWVWAIVLMLAFGVSRWPTIMPPNFSAAYALAFCAGLYFPPLLAWVLPIATLLATDYLVSAFFYAKSPDFHWAALPLAILPNYLGYACLIGIGQILRGKRSWLTLLGGSVAGALLFYLISNTSAWMTLPYAKTFLGWIQALTTGLPPYPPTWTFLWKTLLSSGLFSALFIGSMKAVESVEESKAEKEAPQEREEQEPAETQEPAAS